MKHIRIKDIPIELEKKRIKNMYLRILPPDGRVHISAPMKMSEEEIFRIVERKLSWIRLQQTKIQQRNAHRELEYITGEQIFIWGGSYSLVVKDTLKRNYIELVGDELVLYMKHDSTKEQRERLVNAWYKKTLEEEIPFLLARWERTIGVASSGFRIRDMKTRWGTCNTRTKMICLNLQLAKKPPKCLEYVVVHELVHLLERSHNSIFKGYMDLFLPEWRGIKAELNMTD